MHPIARYSHCYACRASTRIFGRPSGYNCIAAVRQICVSDRESNPGPRIFRAAR